MGRQCASGQGLIEYALIMLLVAIACVGALGLLSGAINGGISGIIASL